MSWVEIVGLSAIVLGAVGLILIACLQLYGMHIRYKIYEEYRKRKTSKMKDSGFCETKPNTGQSG